MSYKIYNNFYKYNDKEIFGFDLDSTLIKFNLNIDTYEFQFPDVIDKLKKISKIYNIVIITNQNHNKYDLFEKKINKLLDTFTKNKLDISIFVSRKNDLYRKPNIKLAQLIEQTYKNKV